jgi:putative two-component system response regulator
VRAGEEIPLAGRIAAVADVFDALTSNRAYRRALPYEEANAEMQRGCGSQFDPLALDAFLEAEDETRAIMGRYTPSAGQRLVHERQATARLRR